MSIDTISEMATVQNRRPLGSEGPLPALVAPRSFAELLDRFDVERSGLHPVARLIVERASQDPIGSGYPDGHRLGLVVEGGAMRGIVSLGMLVLLEQMGATRVFDDIYGSSAGAINSAFYMTGQAAMAATVYYNEMLTSGFISYRRLLRGKPVVSVEYLLDQVVYAEKPLDWESVLEERTRFHPIAFSTTRCEPVDLFPLANRAEVRDALRASGRVPVFAGEPLAFRGDTYLDASMHSSVPFEPALLDGCTHLLVLRTRARGQFRASPSPLERVLAERRLRQLNPRLLEIFRNRADRYREEVEALDRLSSDPASGVDVLQVAPGPADPAVSSMSRSHDDVLRGAMVGMRAASRALVGRECRPLEQIQAYYS